MQHLKHILLSRFIKDFADKLLELMKFLYCSQQESTKKLNQLDSQMMNGQEHRLDHSFNNATNSHNCVVATM